MLRRGVAVASVAAVATLGLACAAAAQDTATGEQLARSCAVCHGRLGISTDPTVPHLAGQPVQYLEKSLLDYIGGARHDPRMSVVVKALTRAEVKALAAWYASLDRDPED